MTGSDDRKCHLLKPLDQNASADALLSVCVFKMADPVYSNTIQRNFSKAAQKNPNFCVDNRDVICIVVCSALLILSLLANAALAYLYYGNDCEPVTECPHLDVDYDAQTQQTFHWDMKNSSYAHCPQQNFPEKWIKAKNGFYVLTTEKQDWHKSRQRCQELGGDLIIIRNKEEQDIVKNLVYTTNELLYWIGLTDSDIEGSWQWVDGTSLNEMFWATPPDDHKGDNPLGEDCVVLNKRSLADWGDVSCLRKESSICEIPCS